VKNKILLVDDNETIIEILSDIFESEDIETVSCLDGASAIAEIDKNIYSSAIVDINLPDMNGRQILAALKKRNQFTQVYILTGAPSMIELSEFIEAGAVDFFTKGELDLKYIVESVKFGIRRQEKWKQVFKCFAK
jgi:DNA-binding response OmpR family regulator